MYLSSQYVGNESYKPVFTDLRICVCWLNLRKRICQNLSWYAWILFSSSQWSWIYLHQSSIWACVLGTEFDFQGSEIWSVSVLLLVLNWGIHIIICSPFKVPSQFLHSCLTSLSYSSNGYFFWHARLVSPPSTSGGQGCSTQNYYANRHTASS